MLVRGSFTGRVCAHAARGGSVKSMPTVRPAVAYTGIEMGNPEGRGDPRAAAVLIGATGTVVVGLVASRKVGVFVTKAYVTALFAMAAASGLKSD